MTQAQHTPGQWFINRESFDCHDGKLSIEVYGYYFIAQVDEGVYQEANARLIAAAPAMLEALRAVAALANGQGRANLMEVAGQAQQIIAQAEGGAQ